MKLEMVGKPWLAIIQDYKGKRALVTLDYLIICADFQLN